MFRVDFALLRKSGTHRYHITRNMKSCQAVMISCRFS